MSRLRVLLLATVVTGLAVLLGCEGPVPTLPAMEPWESRMCWLLHEIANEGKEAESGKTIPGYNDLLYTHHGEHWDELRWAGPDGKFNTLDDEVRGAGGP